MNRLVDQPTVADLTSQAAHSLPRFYASVLSEVLKPLEAFCSPQANRDVADALHCSSGTLNEVRYSLSRLGFLECPSHYFYRGNRVFWTPEGLYILSIIYKRSKETFYHWQLTHSEAALILDLPVSVIVWLHEHLAFLREEPYYCSNFRYSDVGWKVAGLRALAEHSAFFLGDSIGTESDTDDPLMQESILERLQRYRYEYLPENAVSFLLGLTFAELARLRLVPTLFTEGEHYQLTHSVVGVVWRLDALLILARLHRQTELYSALQLEVESRSQPQVDQSLLLNHAQVSFLTGIPLTTLLVVVQRLPAFCFTYCQSTYVDTGGAYLEALWTTAGLEEVQKPEYRSLLDQCRLQTIEFQGHVFKYNVSAARHLLRLSEIFYDESCSMFSDLKHRFSTFLTFGSDYVTAPLAYRPYPMSLSTFGYLNDFLLFSERGLQRMQVLTERNKHWFYSASALSLLPPDVPAPPCS